MNKIYILLLLITLSLQTKAQTEQHTPTVFVYIQDTIYPMKTTTSQTQIKKGWDIQGYNVGKKTKRYFQEKKGRQIVNTKPTFAIYPKEQTLNDYALLQLNTKQNARYLPKPNTTQCNYVRIQLGAFNITTLPDFGFAVTPIEPLPKGEYILFDLTAKPINPYGDFQAYDFSVE